MFLFGFASPFGGSASEGFLLSPGWIFALCRVFVLLGDFGLFLDPLRPWGASLWLDRPCLEGTEPSAGFWGALGTFRHHSTPTHQISSSNGQSLDWSFLVFPLKKRPMGRWYYLDQPNPRPDHCSITGASSFSSSCIASSTAVSCIKEGASGAVVASSPQMIFIVLLHFFHPTNFVKLKLPFATVNGGEASNRASLAIVRTSRALLLLVPAAWQ